MSIKLLSIHFSSSFTFSPQFKFAVASVKKMSIQEEDDLQIETCNVRIFLYEKPNKFILDNGNKTLQIDLLLLSRSIVNTVLFVENDILHTL